MQSKLISVGIVPENPSQNDILAKRFHLYDVIWHKSKNIGWGIKNNCWFNEELQAERQTFSQIDIEQTFDIRVCHKMELTSTWIVYQLFDIEKWALSITDFYRIESPKDYKISMKAQATKAFIYSVGKCQQQQRCNKIIRIS